MKSFIFSFAFLSIAFSYAQEFDSTAWRFAQTIQSKDISKHLRIIASDEFEGRATGKKGQKMAKKYLINQFKRAGIQDYKNLNYEQRFELVEQENTGLTIKIENVEYQLNKDFLFNPAIVDNRELNTELVFVGFGIPEDNYNSYANIDVQNKVVFLLDGQASKLKTEKEWALRDKVDWCKKNGALGVFVNDSKVKVMLEKYEHYFTKPKMKLAEEANDSFFTVKMTDEMTDQLLNIGGIDLNKIKKKGIKEKDRFTTDLTISINKPTHTLFGENVIAFIPGTEKKEEVIVLTAHYDHLGKEDSVVYNGADDDGTGTVALIEIAEAFQEAVKNGFRPKRSILIMPVSGEEKGLLGSKYYTNNPIFPLENTVANLNIDMIGRYDEAHKKDSNYVYLIGSDKLSQDLHEVSEMVNSTYTQFNLDYTFNDEKDPNRFYYRSDHYNFAKNNVPVIFYFSGVHEDYHKETDTVDKIDFDKTARIARLVFLTAWQLANSEERIQLKVD
tara:strand:- start:12812 stop:14314 length:1503 start_codon:yes stop_codon:yes gene_type:complete